MGRANFTIEEGRQVVASLAGVESADVKGYVIVVDCETGAVIVSNARNGDCEIVMARILADAVAELLGKAERTHHAIPLTS